MTQLMITKDEIAYDIESFQMLKLMKKAYTSENSSMFADGVKQSRSSIIWKWRENGSVLGILCRWETLMTMKRMLTMKRTLKLKRMLTMKIYCAIFCSEPASSYDVTFALHHKDESTITVASPQTTNISWLQGLNESDLKILTFSCRMCFNILNSLYVLFACIADCKWSDFCHRKL